MADLNELQDGARETMRDMLEDLVPGVKASMEKRAAALPQGRATNAQYAAAFSTPDGRAVLDDLIARFVFQGTYAAGADPSRAVYDAGLRAVPLEILWRMTQEG